MKSLRKMVTRWSGGLLLCVSFSAVFGHATLSTSSPRGQQTVQIPVAGRNSEICVIPKHFTNGQYSGKDANAESNLCSLDTNVNAPVCPKTNSTNPGLDVYSLPSGSTIKSVEDARCKTADAKKVAKYKLSTSCSYTPSILGYYHLSRILGGVADVPPSVLRTYDLQEHIALGRIALEETPATALIHQTWAGLMAQLTAGANASRRDFLLTADFSQSYGALSVNPTKDVFYKEFFTPGADNVSRAANFRDKNPIMLLLARPDSASTLVGRNFTAQNVQTMVQLKDASDMIVLDTLMNQQDRFGNIAYVETYYYLDKTDPNPDGSAKLKSSKKLTPDEIKQLGALQAKKMLLKDNDCGVAKQNIAKQAGLAAHMAHIDPNTYRQLLQLDAKADSPDTRDFFLQELIFTSQDYMGFRSNLKDLVTKLHQACSQGRLKLDLDLQAHFSGTALQSQSCEISGDSR
jgi:hypothetical protein